MTAVIIADNLINDYCSPEAAFQHLHVNIGIDEIGRLFGEEHDHGNGPLPVFLNTAALAGEKDGSVRTIFLRDVHDPADERHQEELLRYGEHGLMGSRGVEFVASIHTAVERGRILNSPNLGLPLHAFADAFADVTGAHPLRDDAALWQDIPVLLAGVHTEKRVLHAAYVLRHILGFRKVAVTPHLLGSSNRDAHLTALRSQYPDALITVLPGLSDALSFVGLHRDVLGTLKRHACEIQPDAVREQLSPEQRMIVEVLCMHWTRSELKPLKGGFSGSFLFLANGWKGKAQTEPMVMKIDAHRAIRRELKGYERVKDLLGKHVPSFTPPVSFGDFTGIGMEFASMEGLPSTLQDLFENADSDARIQHFIDLFRRSLALLKKHVYVNTLRQRHISPYRHFLLHVDKQAEWLKENLDSIERQSIGDSTISMEMLRHMFDIVRKNDDALPNEVCLSHGDLNLANIMCDTMGNIWAIDWTHADNHPLEMDFAKLENDIKFVMSKQLAPEDFGKLQRFEDFLLSQPVLPAVTELPPDFGFIAWDLRFKKIYRAVLAVREHYFSIRGSEDWLVYRIALLKYSIHTLSFDASRGRGECGPVQLWYALLSTENLLFQLVADDFQLKIRGERPASYPPRFRVSIDQAVWSVPSPDYAPPYYVAPLVLAHARYTMPGGWAHAEEEYAQPFPGDDATLKDEQGRLLNPNGRTGIAGRGALGRWGANPLVLPVMTRVSDESGELEVLLQQGPEGERSMPEDFVHFHQNFEGAMNNYLRKIAAPALCCATAQVLHEGYLYDARQTDHAWIHAISYHFHLAGEQPELRSTVPGGVLKWTPLTAELINEFPSGTAAMLRKAVAALQASNAIDGAAAALLLKHTG